MRIRRSVLGLTAFQVAVEAGIPEWRVYAIERGRARARPDELFAIARALDSSPETLFPELAEASR